MIFETIDGLFELAVLIGFCYLYFSFKEKFKITGLCVYKFISLGFAFSVLSILLPMIAIFVSAALLGDNAIDQIFLFNDIPYYLSTTSSLVCFMIAAKKSALNIQ